MFGVCIAVAWLSSFWETMPQSDTAPIVRDIFDRDLKSHGLVLVDWEGHIGNPAIEFYVAPPSDAISPVTAVLHAGHTTAYFAMPNSKAAADGATVELHFDRDIPVPVFLSVFPDRNSDGEQWKLDIKVTDASKRNWQL